MKKIVIEIDGVRHQLMPTPQGKDYCTKDKCSLYKECQRSSVGLCVPFAPTGYHFEKEQTQGDPANT